jgi:ribonuclease T2
MLRPRVRFLSRFMLRVVSGPVARGIVEAAAIALGLMLGAQMVAGTTASAQSAETARTNAPGRFDFYVLALSWSPSFCEATRERGRRVPAEQCGARPYSFVVHGLWPQYERGFPSYCQVPAPRLNRGIVNSMLDLMPSPRLVFHEWDSHGTCSGLSARAFFDTVRKARAAVTIPPQYESIEQTLTVSPNEVIEAFVKANAGLKTEDIAVDCDSRRLREVRICMTKDFTFRACGEIVRRSCRNQRLVMPPVRGGHAADVN